MSFPFSPRQRFSRVSKLGQCLRHLLVGLGFSLAAAMAGQAQEAVFTPLGPLVPGGAAATAVRISGTAEAPVVIGSFSPGGVAQWTAQDGWQVITAQFNAFADVSPDGTRLLVHTSGPIVPDRLMIDRATGQIVDLPPFPVPEGYEVVVLNPAAFYGASGLVGEASYKPIGSYTGYVQTNFRVDLATGTYVLLPKVSDFGQPLGSIKAASADTGRLVFHTGSVHSNPRIVLLDADGSQKEVVWNSLSLSDHPAREYRISPNGRWVTATSAPTGPLHLLTAPTTIQRWDMDSTPAGYRRLGQPFEDSIHWVWGNVGAILDDGTTYGKVIGHSCVWHATETYSPRVNVLDELQSHYGLSLPGWSFSDVSSVSRDGRLLVLRGFSAGLAQQVIVTLSEPLPEPTAAAQPRLWMTTWQHETNSSFDLTYTSTALGAPQEQSIMLDNTGDAPLQIFDVEITGPHASEFSVTGLNESGIIDVGEADALTVWFSPRSPGTKTAVMKFSTNDPLAPDFTVNLTGEGPSPVLYLRPSGKHLETQMILHAALGRTVETHMILRNNGNQEAVGVELEIVDADLPGLEIVTPIPETLAAGEGLTVILRFTGTEVGSSEGQIILRCDHSVAQPVSLQLKTKASTPVPLTVKDQQGNVIPSGTGELDFDQVTSGAALRLPIRLENPGDEAFDVKLKLSGRDVMEYDIEMSTGYSEYQSFRVPAQGSIIINPVFEPSYSTDIDLKATLTIDGPTHMAEPYLIQLTGQAIAKGAPKFFTSPQTEINTATLNLAKFRVTGTMPMSYRIVKNGVPEGTWWRADTVNSVDLKRTKFSDDNVILHIDLRNESGTTRSPPFRRMTPSLLRSHEMRAGEPDRLTFHPPITDESGLEFHWLKDGEPVIVSEFVSHSFRPYIGFRPRPSDAGRYSCLIKVKSPHSGPDALVGDCVVTVIGPPSVVPFSFRPTRVMEPMELFLQATHDTRIETHYTVKGLPPGIRYSHWGIIYGQVALSAAAREPQDYQVTVQAKNSLGVSAPYTTTWRVEPFTADIAGTYHGTLARQTGHDEERALGGSVTVTFNNKGSFTGRIITGGVSRHVKGSLHTPPPEDLPASYDPPLIIGMAPEDSHIPLITGISTPIRMTDGGQAVLGLGFEGTLLVGVLKDAHTAIVTAYRQETAPLDMVDGKKPGRYHFKLGIETEGAPDVALPEGHGFSTLLVSPSGVVNWAGKLPDGTAFTGRSGLGHLTLDDQPESWVIPMHQTLYAKRGSVQGLLAFQAGNPVGEAQLDWNKTPGTKADRLYPRIPLTVLNGEGSRYQVMQGAPLLDGAFDLETEEPNGQLRLQSAALLGNLDLSFAVTDKGKITFPSPAPLARPSLKLVASTGLFTLTSRLTQTDTADRSLSGAALWIPHLDKAVGAFTLPEVPDAEATPPTTAKTAPIRAGLMEVQPASAP